MEYCYSLCVHVATIYRVLYILLFHYQHMLWALVNILYSCTIFYYVFVLSPAPT